MDKPAKLYRGITLDDDKFKDMNVLGQDMLPPNPPKIDEQGRKVVGDGNEYGVYMTTNQIMANDVYGKCHTTGRKLSDVRLGSYNNMICMPKVGVVFQISPEHCENLRKPWITAALEGHYNNGFDGEEWIADKIKTGGYSVTRIEIGRDILHDSKSKNIESWQDIQKIQEQACKVLKDRETHLEQFNREISKLPAIKQRNLTSDELKVYRELFGDKQLANADTSKMSVNTEQEKGDFLLASEYQSGESDLNSLRTLYSIVNSPTIKGVSVESALEGLVSKKIADRETIYQKRLASGRNADMSVYDRDTEKLKGWSGLLLQKNKEAAVSENENQAAFGE